MVQSSGLRILGVSAGYAHALAVRETSAEIPSGAIVGVIGPNGAGKSTLLKALAGVLPLRSGSVDLDGVDPRRQPGRVAFVPQREEVNWEFPVTARDVVLMGRYRQAGWLRRPGRADRGKAEAA
ncbi:MAG: metal ABC transporter ATP-binding protein, partial [Tepidiformaceae bacterium]